MNFNIEKQYYKFRRFISRPDEKEWPSGGFFPPRVREKAIQLCLNKTGRLLDVGCGRGLFLRELAAPIADLELIGIDSSGDILDIAKKNTAQFKKIKVICAQAKSLPFIDGSFFTVVCLNMLNNLSSREEAEEAIRQMGRTCKIGGSIIFDIRNSRNIFLYYCYKLAKYYNPSFKSPLKTYKIEKIKIILDKMNFRITKLISIGFPFMRFAPVILVEATNLG